MTRVLTLMAIALGVSTASCASPFRPMVRVNIDPYFSPHEQILIIEAAHEWFGEIPDLLIEVNPNTSDKRGGWVGPADQEKCDKKGLYGYTQLSAAHAPRIHLCMADLKHDDVRFYWVAVHEFGHAFSRRTGHIEEKGNVMYPRYHDEAGSLTQADVDYVRAGL